MKIQLSDHFSYKRLLRFVAPSILMLLCTSVYSIVDGFFVSNYVGKTPFAALNLVMPVLMGVGTLGFMAGTGGSAVVSMTLGEGKKELANEYFSLIVYVTLAVHRTGRVPGTVCDDRIPDRKEKKILLCVTIQSHANSVLRMLAFRQISSSICRSNHMSRD